MLIPDHQIRKLCERFSLVVPYIEEHLNPASIDVTIGDTIMVEVEHTTEFLPVIISHYTKEDPYWIAPGEFFLTATQETFNLPDDIGAQFVLKSSRGREGWDHVESGWADPGWHGSKLTMELFNARRYHSLPIWPGLRIGQMKFMYVDGSVEKSYAVTGRYNNDKTVAASRG